MWFRACLVTALSLLTVWSAKAVAVGQYDRTAENPAIVAVNAFLRALKAEDIDALMKVADVPFFDDGKRLVRDSGEIRSDFASQMKERDFTGITFKINQVQAFSDISNKLRGKVGELLKRVLGKGDQIVTVEIVFANGKREKLAMMVDVRDKEARIVGLRDLP